MGDSAEFEKLGALEARLAAAIDRIAKGMAARGGDGGDGAATEDAVARKPPRPRQDAEARAAELAQRVAALEARLAETQDALGAAEKTSLAEAPPAADHRGTRPPPRRSRRAGGRESRGGRGQAALQARVAELGGRRRSRRYTEGRRRCGCRACRSEAAGGTRPRRTRRGHRGARQPPRTSPMSCRRPPARLPEDRVLALRPSCAGSATTVDQMSSGLDELRSVANGDGMDGVNRVLEAQVAALTQARKAEAAELGRILSDLMAAEAVREEEARNA
jgi:hypothetical protein